MSTNIEWTSTKNPDGSISKGETWNPTAGCSKVSPGCKNCYAIKDAVRLSGNNNPKISEKYAGTTSGNNWSGQINLANVETLLKPYFWTRPRKIFVNSMSDIFHENISFEWIDKVFSIMSLSPQHTFQVLTKRAERMHEYFESFKYHTVYERGVINGDWLRSILSEDAVDKVIKANFSKGLPNVWLGVSCENQKEADERIPYLLKTPAAVRWLSCEPLLGEINFKIAKNFKCSLTEGYWMAETKTVVDDYNYWMIRQNGISWVVVGGESGNGARPCSVDWIRSIVEQCKSASVPVFVKQLGEWSYDNKVWGKHLPAPMKVMEKGKKSFPFQNHKDKKGGDISEFPQDLQIREFPKGF